MAVQEAKLAEEEALAKSLPAGSEEKAKIEAAVAQQEELVEQTKKLAEAKEHEAAAAEHKASVEQEKAMVAALPDGPSKDAATIQAQKDDLLVQAEVAESAAETGTAKG